MSTENLRSGRVVVKSAKDSMGFDASDSLNLASDRRILILCSMRSDVVVVACVRSQNLAWMHLSRSTKPFYQGETGRADLSRMSVASNRRVTTAP